MNHPQLTLALGLPPLSSFETFHADGSNLAALDTLKAFCKGSIDEKQMLLWGAQSVGKTHLLSAACQQLANAGFQVAYLPAEMASRVDALQSMETMDLLCLDDIHLLSGEAEEAVFHAINRCRETDTRLLFASLSPIDEMQLTLPDLKTRLAWGPVFQLHEMADEALPTIFRLLLEERSLDVPDDVVDYVMRRYPRQISALKALVDRIDQASMTTQRRVTIPLVKSLSELTA